MPKSDAQIIDPQKEKTGCPEPYFQNGNAQEQIPAKIRCPKNLHIINTARLSY
jgi:hypothetical protein